MLPSGYSVTIYDNDFNYVDSYEITDLSTELDPELFFEKLEKNSETHDMNDEYF